MTKNGGCQRCGHLVKTSLHALRDWFASFNARMRLVHCNYWEDFFNSQLANWWEITMNKDLLRDSLEIGGYVLVWPIGVCSFKGIRRL